MENKINLDELSRNCNNEIYNIISVNFQILNDLYAQALVKIESDDDEKIKLCFASLLEEIKQDKRLFKLWEEAEKLI